MLYTFVAHYKSGNKTTIPAKNVKDAETQAKALEVLFGQLLSVKKVV